MSEWLDTRVNERVYVGIVGICRALNFAGNRDMNRELMDDQGLQFTANLARKATQTGNGARLAIAMGI